MSDITGAENSHIAFSPVIGADYSEFEVSIKDFEEMFLSTAESEKLFQIWFSKQNDPDEANAFLNKIKYFSLISDNFRTLDNETHGPPALI